MSSKIVSSETFSAVLLKTLNITYKWQTFNVLVIQPQIKFQSPAQDTRHLILAPKGSDIFGKIQQTRLFFILWHSDPSPGHGRLLGGFSITLIENTTLGRTPLDEWSVQRRDLHLTHTNTHNTHNRQSSLLGFRPTIPASYRPQTRALDRVATGIGN